MAKPIRYTPAQRKEMVARALKLKAEGMMQAKIVKELGIHVNTLKAWLNPKPAGKSAKTTPKKAAKARPKKKAVKRGKAKAAAVKGGLRYTPEQKRAMKDKAIDMLKHGSSKLAIQKELGVAYKTLANLLGKKVPKASKKRAKRTKISAADPVAQMAGIRKRILDINNNVAQLGKEKAKLQDEMKAVYKRLGKEIMG